MIQNVFIMITKPLILVLVAKLILLFGMKLTV